MIKMAENFSPFDDPTECDLAQDNEDTGVNKVKQVNIISLIDSP